MNIAHAIGEDKCTIYSQDGSVKKIFKSLRLKPDFEQSEYPDKNIIQGNTICTLITRTRKAIWKVWLYRFQSTFKPGFFRLLRRFGQQGKQRTLFAGIPKVPNKAKEKYDLPALLQHIMHTLSKTEPFRHCGAYGFYHGTKWHWQKIGENGREQNALQVWWVCRAIFCYYGTNVSIVFLDKGNTNEVVLIDASNLEAKP